MGSRYIYRFSRTILIAIFLIGSTLLPILTYSPVSASTSTTDKKLTYKYDKLFNVGNPSGYSRVNSVTTDSSGNVYITGYINGQVTLPGANGFSVNLPIKNTNPNSMPSPMSMHQPTPFGPNSSFGPKNQIKPNADSLSGTMFIAKLDTNN
ncbi:MAG: SBBP repeat-containing protein, partial [bacterium]